MATMTVPFCRCDALFKTDRGRQYLTLQEQWGSQIKVFSDTVDLEKVVSTAGSSEINIEMTVKGSIRDRGALALECTDIKVTPANHSVKGGDTK